MEEFKKKVLSMDKATLEREIEFQDKCIFFTKRAADRELEDGDRSMRNQLERMNAQREFMLTALGGKIMEEKAAKPQRKAKRARVSKKRS